MEVTFNNKDLEALYSLGKSKAYRKVPPNVTRKLVRAYEVLVSSETIQDIWLFPAYKFESLGNSRYSMRLTIVWRLEMNITWKNSDCTIGIIGLENLSYHYGG